MGSLFRSALKGAGGFVPLSGRQKRLGPSGDGAHFGIGLEGFERQGLSSLGIGLL